MSIRPNKTIALLTVTKRWKWPKWWTSLISGEVNCGISIQWESIQPLKGMKWYLLWCGWILQIVVVVVQSLSHVLPNKLQNARLPCLSLSFRICSNSCPLSWWYYLTLSSSADPFYFFLQSFGESGSFPMSQPLASGGQSTGPSASASVLLVSIYSRLIFFRIDWFDHLAVQGTLKRLLQHCSSKASSLWCSAFFMVQLTHLYMTTGKIVALTIWTFVGKVISLLFNKLSRFVIAFLPRSKHLLISWLQSLICWSPRK